MSAAALDRLLREQHPRIRAVCLRILGNHADADDAAQNALIQISRAIDGFDGRSSLNTWVYRVAVNAALDEARRRQRRPLSLVTESFEPADLPTSDAFDAVDSSDSIEAALAAIPEEFRVALVLRDIGGFDYDEIANILNIPGGTVRSRIARGRGRLADALGNHLPLSDRQNPGSP